MKTQKQKTIFTFKSINLRQQQALNEKANVSHIAKTFVRTTFSRITFYRKTPSRTVHKLGQWTEQSMKQATTFG